MVTITYEKIFSRFLSRLSDPRIVSWTDDEVYEWELEFLHSATADVRFRNAFSAFKCDDVGQEVIFELEYSLDDQADSEYVIDLIVLGMVIAWMGPEVENLTMIGLMIGGKEEKKLVDHHSVTKERYNELQSRFYKKIRDRDYLYNDYIEGYI